MRNISADIGRERFIRRANDTARSKGDISDELLERLGYGNSGDSGLNLRRESGSELQADTGKSPNQQSGVSGENADQRGLTKGKASRELDLDYDESIEATKTVTNRELLANALESAAQSDDEYHSYDNAVTANEEKRAELRQEIKAEIRGTKMAVCEAEKIHKIPLIKICRQNKKRHPVMPFFVRQNYFAAASVFAMISSPL